MSDQILNIEYQVNYKKIIWAIEKLILIQTDNEHDIMFVESEKTELVHAFEANFQILKQNYSFILTSPSTFQICKIHS